MERILLREHLDERRQALAEKKRLGLRLLLHDVLRRRAAVDPHGPFGDVEKKRFCVLNMWNNERIPLSQKRQPDSQGQRAARAPTLFVVGNRYVGIGTEGLGRDKKKCKRGGYSFLCVADRTVKEMKITTQ